MYAKRIDVLRQVPVKVRFVSFEPLLGPIGEVDLTGIAWAIVGGESGPGYRAVKEEWISEIREQCRLEDIAFFFNQWGGRNQGEGSWTGENGMNILILMVPSSYQSPTDLQASPSQEDFCLPA